MTVHTLTDISDLQATIALAVAGDTIVLPGGTFSIPAGVQFIDGITIADQATTKVLADGLNTGFNFSGRADITIKHIAFELANGANAVRADGALRLTLDTLTIDSNFDTALAPEVGGMPVLITNSSFVTVSNCAITHTFGGVYLVYCTDSLVQDNTISDLGYGGVNITGHRIVVTGNTITNAGTPSIDSVIGGGDGITVGEGSDITLHANVITAGTCYQINVAGRVVNMVVTDNILRQAFTSSVYFIDVEGLQVSGNDFADGHWLGVAIESGRNVDIRNNTLDKAAVYLASDVWEAAVQDNTFTDAGYGVVGTGSLYDTNQIEFAPGGTPALLTVIPMSPDGHMRLAPILGATDLDDAGYSTFRLLDADKNSTSAGLVVGGYEVDPNGGILTLAASQVSTARLSGADAMHAETLWLAAYNGIWSDWKQVVVRTVSADYFGNRAPTVDAAAASLASGSQVPARSLMSAFDEDGNPIVAYHLLSSPATAGGARILIDGQPAPEGIVTVYASELRDPHHLTIVAGSAVGGTVFYARANDGTVWSDWAPINITSVAQGGANRAPNVMTEKISIETGTSVRLAEAVRGFDTDGGTVTHYRVLLPKASSSNAHVVVDGVTFDGSSGMITITAKQFETATLTAATLEKREMAWVRAYDGKDWSDWTQLNIDTMASGSLGNFGPSVIETSTKLATNATLAAPDIVKTFDREGDAPLAFRFLAPSSGAADILKGGVLHDPLAGILTVSMANLASVSLATGDSATSYVYVQAFDGSDWGEWARIALVGVAPA